MHLKLLEEAHKETREMRNSNIELFKWKIGSLITITGLFFLWQNFYNEKIAPKLFEYQLLK